RNEIIEHREHLKELRNNAYGKTEDEDVVNHIAKVLEIYNLIKTHNMDTDRLRVDDEDEGPDYIEFKAWLNSKFYNHKRMDGMTKSAFTDDIKSSDKEWEESYYGNPRMTNTDSFFKPYLDAQEKGNSYEIEKWNVCNQKYRGGKISKVNDITLNNGSHFDNIKDEQLNERVCRAKKFKVTKYSLGPNE
ncbi:hypothetical protein Tco_1432701, partial [Tanacetum coccineum]